MMKNYQASIKTPFAHLGLCFRGNQLTAIDFIESDKEIKPCDKTAANVCSQIRRYIESPRMDKAFEIMCSIQGTPFQKKVWNELKKIPSGEVVTYGQLAKKLGTSARAVGNACRKNPIPLVIPCHRVVSSNGIGGYAGDTQGGLLQVKSWLLKHEGVSVS
jgi:methylated-DNA-[protein]-cysteine S-methyltransferase